MSALRTFWARFFPSPTFYGWAIVGVGFLCSALSAPGQSFVISLYLEHLITDLGVSRVELSSLYAAATLLAAACLPLVGGLSDRASGRWFLTPVVVLMAGAMVLLARAESLLVLGIAFFALRLLGQGAIGLGTLTTTVRWFSRYRGRALATVSLGYAAGEIVFPGLIHTLIATVGWRGSLLVLAAAYLFLFSPLVGRTLRERSSTDGPLDGAIPEPLTPVSDPVPVPEQSLSLRDTLRMPVFWGLLACVSVPPLVMTAVVFHQVAVFASQGWGAALVPSAFMAFALGGVVATYSTGLVLERVPSRFGITASMALTIIAFVSMLLPLAPLPGSLLYGGLLGLGAGAIAAANSIVWPDYFGIGALGAIKGVVNAVRNGASAIGPPLAAVLMTAGGSFAPAILVFAGMTAVAGLASLAMPDRGTRTPDPSVRLETLPVTR